MNPSKKSLFCLLLSAVFLFQGCASTHVVHPSDFGVLVEEYPQKKHRTYKIKKTNSYQKISTSQIEIEKNNFRIQNKKESVISMSDVQYVEVSDFKPGLTMLGIGIPVVLVGLLTWALVALGSYKSEFGGNF